MKLFIGCSSRNEIPNKYMEDCKILLEELFRLENDLVFGACGDGIMGLSYDIAKDNSRDILGICPDIYKSQLDSLECLGVSVKTVSERTDKLIENSDALIFLPGGIGTIYEIFAAVEGKRSGEYNKPIIIYNSCGYFDKLLSFLELIYDENFASRNDKYNYCVCDNVSGVINYLNNYKII